MNLKHILYTSMLIFTATAVQAESWNIMEENVNSRTGKTELQLSRYESMNPDECRQWVSEGVPPYGLSGETTVVETKVLQSTKFIETGITVVCQGTGKKGNVLMAGPKDNIEALNLPMRNKN